MDLVHIVIYHSAEKIYDFLVKRHSSIDINAGTHGTLIHGSTATTPLIHMAVLAAARNGCSRTHPSWDLLQKVWGDKR
jgi:hypothetical protein